MGENQAHRSFGAIDEVVGAQEMRQKALEIGNEQAWYYPDNTLVLWRRSCMSLSEIPVAYRGEHAGLVGGRASSDSWSNSFRKRLGLSPRAMARYSIQPSTRHSCSSFGMSRWRKRHMARRLCFIAVPCHMLEMFVHL